MKNKQNTKKIAIFSIAIIVVIALLAICFFMIFDENDSNESSKISPIDTTFEADNTQTINTPISETAPIVDITPTPTNTSDVYPTSITTTPSETNGHTQEMTPEIINTPEFIDTPDTSSTPITEPTTSIPTINPTATTTNAPMQGNPIDWDTLILRTLIPKISNPVGEIIKNNNELLSVDIYNVTSSSFSIYVLQCMDLGFTIEAKNNTNSYSAYNKDGSNINVTLKEETMTITAQTAPKVAELKWPINELCKKLPTPKHLIGTYNINSENSLYIYLDEYTIDEYQSYKDNCISSGFIKGSHETNTLYSAENQDGIKIEICWHEYNAMTITISTK